jgi:hypothetical protein
LSFLAYDLGTNFVAIVVVAVVEEVVSVVDHLAVVEKFVFVEGKAAVVAADVAVAVFVVEMKVVVVVVVAVFVVEKEVVVVATVVVVVVVAFAFVVVIAVEKVAVVATDHLHYHLPSTLVEEIVFVLEKYFFKRVY